MDRLVQALRFAEENVGWLPVSLPGLDVALKVALTIAELLQEAKETRSGWRKLAVRAAEYSLKIYEQLKEGPATVDITSTAKYIQELLSTLQEVENLTRRRLRINFFEGVWRKDELKQEVEDLKTRLDDAFRMFSVLGAIATQQTIAQMALNQAHIIEQVENQERTSTARLECARNNEDQIIQLMKRVSVNTVERDEDGTMMLRREDIILLREMDPAADPMECDDPSPDEQHVVRYQARIRGMGEYVIAKKFLRQDESFRAAIERSKQHMHPHISTLLAYSSPECRHAFIVIDGGREQVPFEKCFQALRGLDKYMRVLEMARQLQSAFLYMEEHGFLLAGVDEQNYTTLDSQDLFFTPEGTIRWDVDGWEDTAWPSMVAMEEGYIEFCSEVMDSIRALNSNTLAKLQNSVNALDPITRAAALVYLWDRLTEFADFNRDESYHFAVGEDIPWVGSGTQSLGFRPTDPEGKPVYGEETVDYTWIHSTPHLHPFNEDEPETEYLQDLDDEYLSEISAEPEEGIDGPACITSTVHTEDENWRRHTVLDMDYDLALRTVQKVEEPSKCRNFFLTQALNLDFNRYLADDHEFDRYGELSVVHSLSFITNSYLVGPGSSPLGKPPHQLYFYERVHDNLSVDIFDEPWGYWSTSPEPVACQWPYSPIGRAEKCEFVQETGIDLEYLGFTDTFKFVWTQNVAGFLFRTETMVAVHMLHLTADERLLLREVQKSLADAYDRNRRTPPAEVRKSVRRKRVEFEDEEEEGNEEYWRTGRHSARRRRIE